MTISFPSTKATKDAIRAAIGTTATFIISGDRLACSVCSGADYYDEVNEASLNPYCPTCGGKYWLGTNDISSGVVAHVRWKIQDKPDKTVGGDAFEGDCIITIDIDAISTANLALIKEVRVDSRKLEIYKTIYRGVPTRDRIRFVCREFDKI